VGWQPYSHLRADCLDNVGSLTSHNPMGLRGLLRIQMSGFDSQRYQIFWEVVGLERGPLSLASGIEELLGRKSSGSRSRNPRIRLWRLVELTTRHPLSAKVGNRLLLDQYISGLWPPGFCFFVDRSSRTVALGSTELPRGTSTRNCFSRVKCWRRARLTT
jgi:hypothetical protein